MTTPESRSKKILVIDDEPDVVRYLEALGMDEVHAHDLRLNRAATEAIVGLPGLRVLGPQDPELRGSTLTFVVDGIESHEVGMVLDELGNVAVRTGMHCNHAWFHERGLTGAVRASFYVYNDDKDVERFVDILKQALGVLSKSA